MAPNGTEVEKPVASTESRLELLELNMLSTNRRLQTLADGLAKLADEFYGDENED